MASVLSSGLSTAWAGLTPTAPGPGQTFNAGSNCTIVWNADQTGTWKNVTIDLMSGSNTNMSLVTNVASSLDGTDPTLTPYNWTCPELDLYSAIYFYQFTHDAQTQDTTWTTRFTIASPNGDMVPPPNATQPSGEAIPWGIGHISANNTSSNTTATNCTDPSDIAHMEQIHIQDLHSDIKEDDDSHEDSRAKSKDESGGGDTENHDNGDDNDNDAGKGKSQPKESSSRESDQGATHPTPPKSKETGTAPEGSSHHNKNAEVSNASAGSAPTAILPPAPKKAHSASASTTGSTTVATAAAVEKPSSTCQCSPDRQSGGLLMNGAVDMATACSWLHGLITVVLFCLVW
ncbi:hypothetical protein BDW22DRAFT_1351693 [Trametopsis cervina]|nr:hypothetical protein BDW22DRAFT_1351693 [Trametopsis cervina]